MGRHTIRAETSRRARKKDILLLPARQSAFLKQYCADQSDLSIDQIRPERLCTEEVRDETESGLNVEERREIPFVCRRSTKIAHHPSKWAPHAITFSPHGNISTGPPDISRDGTNGLQHHRILKNDVSRRSVALSSGFRAARFGRVATIYPLGEAIDW